MRILHFFATKGRHYLFICLKVIAITALFVGIEFVVFYSIKEAQINNYRQKIEASEKAVVSLQESMLKSQLNSVNDDLHYLRDTREMAVLLSETDATKAAEALTIATEAFYNFIRVNPNYDQLRYIDSKGMEQIRINQDSDGRTIVSSEELQDKSDRYYFTETMAISNDHVYQSRLDLNIENGEIEQPYKPMIRFALPVYDKNNDPQGIIIINYKAQSLIDNYNDISVNSEGHSYLIDAEGYYLSGHPDYNFDFMFSEHPIGYRDEYPVEWLDINESHVHGDTIQFYDEHGLHTVTEVALNHEQDHYAHWFIISNIEVTESPYSTYEEPLALIIRDFFKGWYMMVPAFILGWVIIMVMTLRKNHLESITEMAQIDSLTGTFNRNAGLKVAKSSFNYAMKNDMDFSVCFIDLNDLKAVNDLHGHEMGDRYIRIAVELITSGFRDSDQLIRMGGDEFLLAINASAAVVEKNWSRVIEAMNALNTSNSLAFEVSLSHGVASAQEENINDLDSLISFADERMYIEKRKIKENRKNL